MGLIRRERHGAHLVLVVNKARGNAIDPPLVEELIDAARGAADDGEVAGILLASAHPKLFSPGLDLVALADLERPAMRSFMLRFAEAVWSLYALPKPVVVAISGHAVAGGCVLALTADWRVLVPGAQIGLNEVKVGVPLPWSVALLLRHAVAPAAHAKVALLGRNFAGEEALAVGLVDELAPFDRFRETCLARLAEFSEKDACSFARTKSYLRGEPLSAMKAHEHEHIDEWLDAWFSPGTRARIRETVESITRKS